ncbi:hypothetical protein [Symmachiella dynata]|uniref:hypothetical protein n=1 Tax=Symmachiella dynata TaxID=2527995 RepID=UPI0030EDD55B
MRTLAASLVLLVITLNVTRGAEPQKVPVSELGHEFVLTGKLQVPLGKLAKVRGVIVEGPYKGYEGGKNLSVQWINGKYTQKYLQIPIESPFKVFVRNSQDEDNKPVKLKYGRTYEMEVYETGGYVGTPGEVFQKGIAILQTTDHYFRTEVIQVTAKRVAPITFTPEMFVGDNALLQGKAISEHGKAVMVGDGWKIIVRKEKPWPMHMEGKTIETLGVTGPDIGGKVYEFLKGEARLVFLKDQIGRDVELRGRAWSNNGNWWLEYRDSELDVEGMENLPGWEANNHGRSMIIKGRLEKTRLPPLRERPGAPGQQLKEFFIVRNPSWEPLPALLSPERPLPKLKSKP